MIRIIRNKLTLAVHVSKYFLVQPDDTYVIQNTHPIKYHRIKHSTAMREGYDRMNIFREFQKDLMKYKPEFLVAHNVEVIYIIYKLKCL